MTVKRKSNLAVSGKVLIFSILGLISIVAASGSHSAKAKVSDVPRAKELSHTRAETKSENPEHAGLITAMTGKWSAVVEGREISLVRGDSIPFGARLKPKSKDATINVWLVNDEKFRCPGSEWCGRALMPKGEEAPWWVSAFDIFKTRIGDLIKPAGRSPGDRQLPDSIIAISNNELDLTPIFATEQLDGISAVGKFQFRSISLHGKQSDVLEKEVAISDEAQGKKLAASSGIAAGLYFVSALDSSHNSLAGVQPCWVLVVKEQDFERLSESFSRARDSIRGDEKRTPAKLTRLLRAYLVSLALQLFSDPTT